MILFLDKLRDTINIINQRFFNNVLERQISF